jgi:hypothetical protein
MGIDDESSSPGVVFRSCRRRYMPTSFGVRLFREPDAGNLPVRFDEREQETEPGQTGLRRARRKPRPIATGRLKPLRLFSTLLARCVLPFSFASMNRTATSGRHRGRHPAYRLPTFAVTRLNLRKEWTKACAACELGRKIDVEGKFVRSTL